MNTMICSDERTPQELISHDSPADDIQSMPKRRRHHIVALSNLTSLEEKKDWHQKYSHGARVFANHLLLKENDYNVRHRAFVSAWNTFITSGLVQHRKSFGATKLVKIDHIALTNDPMSFVVDDAENFLLPLQGVEILSVQSRMFVRDAIAMLVLHFIRDKYSIKQAPLTDKIVLTRAKLLDSKVLSSISVGVNCFFAHVNANFNTAPIATQALASVPFTKYDTGFSCFDRLMNGALETTNSFVSYPTDALGTYLKDTFVRHFEALHQEAIQELRRENPPYKDTLMELMHAMMLQCKNLHTGKAIPCRIIELHGIAGVGKSSIVKAFNDLFESFLPYKTTPYYRPEDKFWNNYEGQTTVLYDDPTQSSEHAYNFFQELIQLGSGQLSNIPSAFDKQLTFKSQLAFCTTNKSIVKAAPSSIDTGALSRRITYIRVTPVPHTGKIEGSGDSAFWQYHPQVKQTAANLTFGYQRIGIEMQFLSILRQTISYIKPTEDSPLSEMSLMMERSLVFEKYLEVQPVPKQPKNMKIPHDDTIQLPAIWGSDEAFLEQEYVIDTVKKIPGWHASSLPTGINFTNIADIAAARYKRRTLLPTHVMETPKDIFDASSWGTYCLVIDVAKNRIYAPEITREIVTFAHTFVSVYINSTTNVFPAPSNPTGAYIVFEELPSLNRDVQVVKATDNIRILGHRS